jgi:AraC family cel operon transcriptional repressor
MEVFSKYFSDMGSKSENEYPLWLESLLTAMQKKENFTSGLGRMYELSGRSTCHLNRTFRNNFDVTPTGYINNLRLNYARYLLITTRLSVIEISMDSGFNNLSHFYHMFKKCFHMAPSALRAGDRTA